MWKCLPSGSSSSTARGRIVRQERILTFCQFVFAGSQRLVENIGLAMRRAIVQPHAGFDEAGGLFRGNRFTKHL